MILPKNARPYPVLAYLPKRLLLGGGVRVPLSKEARGKIAEVLTEKIKNGPGCPMCGARNFTLGEDLVHLVLQPEATRTLVVGQMLPSVPVICSNCGCTQLVNVFILGIADLVGFASTAKKVEG